MSYQVLARKWRPQSFTEMVGQNHVLRALINAIDSQELHHAYLFTGTRGVGKTTIARILAKCLNCESGITSKPCGTCSACLDIRDGKFVDLIEVDAASRTKVEQTRDLLENVAYAPTRGRFKIYLIDEVHMLSTHSFNALLKTLEEPPAHVKFLLATTDPDRLPMTVLSRCLHFHLKNMPVETIGLQLANILTQEKIPFESPALDLLAHAAQGSMRDALSLLDQAIAYGQGKIETTAVRELLGHLDPQALLQILNALQNKQGDALLAALDVLSTQGIEPQAILDELIQALHQIAMIQLVPERLGAHSDLHHFAKSFSPPDIQLFYQIAVNGRRDLPWMASARLGLEMIVLRMLAFYPQTINVSQAPPQAIKVQTPVASENTPKNNVSLAGKTWADIAPQLGLTGLAMALASHCVLKSIDETQIQLALAPQHAPLLNAASAQRLQDALSTYLGRKIIAKISLEETGEETPALQQEQKQQQAQHMAEEGIKTDPQVQAMMQRLGASIINESITAR
jgi:DNA polymerase-3 subunit gamma/tau